MPVSLRYLATACIVGAACLFSGADAGTCDCSTCEDLVCSEIEGDTTLADFGTVSGCADSTVADPTAGAFTLTNNKDGNDVGVDAICKGICDLASCATHKGTTGGGGGGGNDCFHEDTLINYKGKEYTLAELQAGAEPECHVPHVPTARGVTIATTCGRNVTTTETHLMVTPKGHQLAHTLNVGDELFGDFTGEQKCLVTAVTRTNSNARFFGLNCVHSEVLANGLRASTFGDFHTLPAWYMYYAGLLLGPDAASRLGDNIADSFFQYY